MTLFALVSAFLTLSAPADVAVNVNAQNGELVLGERSFRVTVQTTNTVTQVEFYVGDELRDNDTSTPYEFKLDSLAENDGEVSLKFKAYTSEGDTGERTLKVLVDNGVSKGADFHVQAANESLQQSKWAAARTSARIALKADPNSNPARIAMARACFGAGDLAQAQKYAEDAITADKNSVEGLELLSAVNLQRAFTTVNRGGDRKETLDAIRNALKAAVENRRKTLDLAVDKIGTPTDANLVAAADTAIRAGRYSLAVSWVKPAFDRDNRKVALANRLAFAQMRAGRPQDALQTLNALKKFGELDAYSYALFSVVAASQNDDTLADDMIREAVLSDGENLGVRTAQAFIALKRDRQNVLAQLSTDLSRENGARSEVSYFLSALANRRLAFQQAKDFFQRSVLAEPANVDMYIENGNQSIVLAQGRNLSADDKALQYDSARIMYETALVARPQSHEALTGLAIVSMYQAKPEDALRFARAAASAAPQNAAANYALAGALQLSKRFPEAQAANARAAQLDKKSLEGRSLPDAAAAFRYFNTGGRTPILSAPR